MSSAEQDLAGTEDTLGPIARLNLDVAVEIDHVLAPRRVVEVQVVAAIGLAEQDSRRLHRPRDLPRTTSLRELYLHVLEVRLAVVARVDPRDSHAAF